MKAQISTSMIWENLSLRNSPITEISLAVYTQKQHYQGQLIQQASDLHCCPVPNALPCQIPAAQAGLPLTG